MWDVPGGHVESHESPDQCIVREMKEELGLDLERFDLFSIKEFRDRMEYTFWKRANLDINALTQTEGQALRWFDREELSKIPLAYGFNQILTAFFQEAPFRSSR
jgi:8-oxo-dGTP diphosphatase